jgi:hypothetical protein
MVEDVARILRCTVDTARRIPRDQVLSIPGPVADSSARRTASASSARDWEGIFTSRGKIALRRRSSSLVESIGS